MNETEQAAPGWGSRSGFLAFPEAGPGSASTSPAVRMGVQDRIHRYAWAFDERRRDALENCFTEDAVWEGNTAAYEAVAPIHGRDAIVAWLSGFWTRQRDQRRHLMLSVIVSQETAESANAVASLALTAAEDAQLAIVLTSFYRFRMVRDCGTWRIAHLFEGFDVAF